MFFEAVPNTNLLASPAVSLYFLLLNIKTDSFTAKLCKL